MNERKKKGNIICFVDIDDDLPSQNKLSDVNISYFVNLM